MRKYIELLYNFWKETNKSKFTYNDLRIWYYNSPNGYKRFKTEWHTISRQLRKLAEEGILERYHPKKNKTIFYLTDNFSKFVKLYLPEPAK